MRSKHSSLFAVYRQGLRNAFAVLSIITEPIRLRIRRRDLRRVIAEQVDHQAPETPPVLILMVYRLRNAQMVEIFLRQIGGEAEVRLWALDEVAPELADRTYGCGLGRRFVHFNTMYHAEAIKPGSWVTLVDDDVFFTKGCLMGMIELMRVAGFSLAQPSQSWAGWWTDLFSVARPLVRARDTNCVEQGPLLVADPLFSKLILPLPEDDDMGWGIEAEWYRVKEDRFRIGIIDDCRIMHWGKVANAYPAGPEMDRMHERLSKAGIQSIWHLRTVNRYWWKWQRIPSWQAEESQLVFGTCTEEGSHDEGGNS